jgi:hypothetical protein
LMLGWVVAVVRVPALFRVSCELVDLRGCRSQSEFLKDFGIDLFART